MNDQLLKDVLYQILQNQGAMMLKLIYLPDNSDGANQLKNANIFNTLMERSAELMVKLQRSEESKIVTP